VKSKPKPLEPKVVDAALLASNLIQNGEFKDEDLAKVLRGAPSHAGSRRIRLEFMQKVLNHDQSELDFG
jgi:hypothetical protein